MRTTTAARLHWPPVAAQVVRATNAISALFSLAYVAASGELVAALPLA